MIPSGLRSALAVALALAAAAGPLEAQGSPIVDLILKSRTALNELRLSEADSLAVFALNTFGFQMNRDQRTEILSIAASARFPELIEGVQQHPDSALTVLRELVRMDPDLRLREDISWWGLDSLHNVARATTFAPRVRLRGDAIASEATPALVADGTSTRAAQWHIALVPASGGAPVWSDSLGARRSGAIAIPLRIADGRPSLASATYSLVIVARDSATADSASWRYEARVDAPSLDLVAVPAPLDSASRLPEISAPARSRGITTGIVVGLITAFGTGVLRGTNDLGAAADADPRAMILGGMIAIGGITAGFLDKGTPIPANRIANAKAVVDHAAAVQAARVENQRRINTYRITISLQEAP